MVHYLRLGGIALALLLSWQGANLLAQTYPGQVPGPHLLQPTISPATLSAINGCGGNPSISGTDMAGQLQFGSTSNGACTIVFASAYANVPWCVVHWQSALAVMSYSNARDKIMIAQTTSSANKINFICVGQSGG